VAHSEFSLIERFFVRRMPRRPDVALGIGDDCALLTPPSGQALAVTLDTLVAGVHFHAGADPEAIGHKALAVNLSDLAAMGAEPAWLTLALSLPALDEAWLAAFCRGMFALAERYNVQLVGGDTTRGPLTITMQVHGFVPVNLALRRDGARPGDIVHVTGTPGDAGLALEAAGKNTLIPAEHQGYLRRRLDRPMPRIQQGRDLRGLASAAIDISDGLAQDLGHLLVRSRVGARLQVRQLPRSAAMAACLDEEAAVRMALSGGDDYELCFTVSPRRLTRLRELAANWDCACTEIGVIEATGGLRCRRDDGTACRTGAGYDHFR
jgi:thiamine-monophosphate kinase